MRSSHVITVTICALAVGALSACGSSGATPTQSIAPTTTSAAASLDDCVQPDAHARAITFTAAGESVRGAEFGDKGSVGVVLAHEHGGNLCGWVAYAEHLRDLGYRALAFDFRTNLPADVGSAAQQLRADGATHIVLMGASMGGTASLVAATSTATSVAGVAALSAPSSFLGLDGLGAARQLTIPVLFMAAQDNGEFPGDARAMYAACASSHKQLQVLAGSDHGTQLLHGAVASQATSLLDAFLAMSTSAAS
jgi:pimeloyl-ACP methyl ester carboxylesterase